MILWLLSQPWLPFLVMGILIILAVFIKFFLLKMIGRMFHFFKERIQRKDQK